LKDEETQILEHMQKRHENEDENELHFLEDEKVPGTEKFYGGDLICL
jgi:hypothetical protein